MEENYLKKELYKKIQSDETLFDFLQTGSLDGIWYWDLENSENEWMSEEFWRLLGFSPDEKAHKASEWQDLIFRDDLEIAKENLARHLENPDHPYDQIVRYRHKSGQTIWVRCRGIAIRDNKSGKPLRMLGAHTDITKAIEAEGRIAAFKMQIQALQMQVETQSMKIKMKDIQISDLKMKLAQLE